MIIAISRAILGLVVRHLLTSAGATIASAGIKVVAGLPHVEDLKTVLAGAAIGAAGLIASATKNVKDAKAKVKTQSGPIYKGFNQ